MPWVSIIVWLVTFLLSKSSGASNGSAALAATGAGLATYYLADPSNKDNVLGIGAEDKTTPGSTSETRAANVDTSGLTSIGKTVVSETGSVLKSWGPTGTLGVIAGTAAVTSTNWDKWLPWILGGAALFLLTRN